MNPPVAAVVRTHAARSSVDGVPTDKLVDALERPFVIVPLVNPDNNQHSSNENIRVGHYLGGARFFAGLLGSTFPKP